MKTVEQTGWFMSATAGLRSNKGIWSCTVQLRQLRMCVKRELAFCLQVFMDLNNGFDCISKLNKNRVYLMSLLTNLGFFSFHEGLVLVLATSL